MMVSVNEGETKMLKLALLFKFAVMFALGFSFPKWLVGQEAFQQVVRREGVDLGREYDVSGLTIPAAEIHRLLPRDAIPALTDPKTETARASNWLRPNSRLILVELGEQKLAVPIQILDSHEIVNATIDGQGVAITYCPLCDSAVVFSRTVATQEGDEIELEFGVSGALFNSNVLMYDRTHRGLWSQLGMKAVSGPLVGTPLTSLPFQMVAYGDFVKQHPDAPIVSSDTGHPRNYQNSPYQQYFAKDDLMVPVRSYGKKLKRKTLGLGIKAGEQSWFVPVDQIAGNCQLTTPAGIVKFSRTEAGIVVSELPTDVMAAQSFYYSWSAFFPNCVIVNAETAGFEQK